MGTCCDPGGWLLLPLDSRAAARKPSWPRVPLVMTGVRLCFQKSPVSGEVRPTMATADVKQRLLRKG